MKMPKGYIYSDQGALFGESKAVGFGSDEFYVMEINRDLANEMVVKNHYSKKFYSATRIHLGVIIDDELLGVLQFGAAMNPASGGSVVTGTGFKEYLELNRMWLDDKAVRNSESRAISYAIKYIRKAHPAVKWVQSFSDERCGLFGTGYQAAGFTFHGEHTGCFWELDGEFYHKSILDRAATMKKGKHLLDNLARATRHDLRQFRYLKFMKPRFAKGCNHPEKPYPKPDYAARLVDERTPVRASEAQTLRAAPSFQSDASR